MITIKRCLAILVGLLTAWACHADAGETYYVIQNVETGKFMQYVTDNDLKKTPEAYFVNQLGTTEADIKNALWQITKTTSGTYHFKNVGQKSFLKYNIGNGYYKSCYSTKESDATGFYLGKNPFNVNGYAVSTTDISGEYSTFTYCWYLYTAQKTVHGSLLGDPSYYDWLCSSEKKYDISNISTIKSKPYLAASTFRFLSYGDLLKQAKALGLTSEPTDSTNYSNYATLITDIKNAETSHASTLFSTDLLEHAGLVTIRNRRFGTYLAMDTNGKLYTSTAITSDCIWSGYAEDPTTPNGQYAFTCYGNATDLQINGNRTITLFNAKDAAATTAKVTKKSTTDGTATTTEYRAGYFRMAGVNGNTTTYLLASGLSADEKTPTSSAKGAVTSTSYDLTGLTTSDALAIEDADWTMEPYDIAENIENTSVRESAIQDSLFFRIENEGYSLGYGTKKSGWLADADHVDMRTVDKYLSDKTPDRCTDGTTPEMIYAFSVRSHVFPGHTEKLKASSNTLWHFVRVAAKNGDSPVGVIGKHDNNIYVIKNANTLEYIGLPVANTNYHYMTTTTDKKRAAKVWFEDIGNGQYAIAVRDNDVPEKDQLLGYLLIRSTNDQYDNYRAALTLSTDQTQPKAGSNGAWSILQATTVDAVTATAEQEGDKEVGKVACSTKDLDGFRYVTAYYPFDITPLNKNIRMFKAVAQDDGGILFKEVKGTVPAFNGVLCMAPYKNGDKDIDIEFRISPCTTDNSDFADNILSGVTTSDKKYVFVDETDTEKQAKMRQEIYIFSTSAFDENNKISTVALGLYHPGDRWLMGNRCFIPANKLTTTSGGQAKSLRLMFDMGNGTPTGISMLPRKAVEDNVWYNLMGQPVVAPVRGIYIHNGRKVIIK